MRKELFTGIILLLMAVTIRAQETKDKKDWTFAAGITAYSSNSYAKGWHPWEINLRYKIKGHHVIRAGVAFKKKSGEAMYDNPSLDLVAESFPKYPGFVIMFGNKSEKLHGFSIGYDYDYLLWDQLSIFGGIEGSYAISKEKEDYRAIGTNEFYHNERNLFYNQYDDSYKTSIYNIKPMLGIRYRYKCLMGEFSLGSNIQLSKQTTNNVQEFWITELDIQTRIKDNINFEEKISKVYLHYNLNIYLTF